MCASLVYTIILRAKIAYIFGIHKKYHQKNGAKYKNSPKKSRFYTKSKHFCRFFSEINPLRIAQKRATDLVVKNKRKIPPEKCEKF